MNCLEVYFNNLTNELIQKMQKRFTFIIFQIDMKNLSFIILFQTDMKIINHSIIWWYAHAFLLWKIFSHCQSLIVEFLNENSCYLIEIKLRHYIVASIISQHDDYIKYSINSNMTSSMMLLNISSNFVIIVKCTKNLSIDSFFQ